MNNNKDNVDMKEDVDNYTLQSSSLKYQRHTADTQQALMALATTLLSQRRPRAATGNIEVRKQGSVLCADLRDTIPQICEILATESILGLAVIDSQRDNIACGIIDIERITNYIFYEVLTSFKGSVAPGTTDLSNNVEIKQQCDTALAKLNKATVQDVLDWNVKWRQEHCNTTNGDMVQPFTQPLCIPAGHSLLFAFHLLSNPGVRRLAMVNPAGQICGWYALSMAVSDIRQFGHLLRDFMSRPVSQYMTKKVISLSIEEPAYKAFQLMLEHDITGIALVDTDNKLTGTISMRDLRGCGKSLEHLDRLWLPLREFKALTRSAFPQLAPPTHWSEQVTPQGARFIELEQGTLKDVLLGCNDGNIYRLWVLDNRGELRGCISLTDVIRAVLETLDVFSNNNQAD